MHIGKPIGSMSYDRLDPAAPEFERFSVQQIYFPTVTNFLAQPPGGQPWFGTEKREMSARWRSWLSVLTMTEDDNDRHELRGHPGLFVTDGAAVPTSLCVNPSLTIAALAERASAAVVARAADSGVQVAYGAPAPGGQIAARRATLPLARTLGT